MQPQMLGKFYKEKLHLHLRVSLQKDDGSAEILTLAGLGEHMAPGTGDWGPPIPYLRYMNWGMEKEGSWEAHPQKVKVIFSLYFSGIFCSKWELFLH